ncbi:MAG: SusC/RagA family TonB-linked outer membrane protein, partial [Bacteroidales bacterium]
MCFVLLGSAYAQRAITGKVIDDQGLGVAGASVVQKGTVKGTITDADGNYSLTVPEGVVLQISFMGMKTQEVTVGTQSVIDITMNPDAIGVDEVVVVGYGTQKKVNLTGSVSSINFEDEMQSRPVTNVSSALSGLSSGVTVRQGAGKPGEDGASIRIRGVGTLNNNNPLIIIDGMEGVLDAINPDDIASISILKDAAASAIYGSRAANGVVLVSTKKGNRERTSVTYSGNFSISSPSNLLEFVSDYPTYMRLINESARNIGSAEHFSSSTIEAWEAANANPDGSNENGVPNWLAFPNTNWATEMYESNLVQEHNLSVSGGSEKSTYLLSLGYLDNPGLVQNTGVKRYTFRINIEADIKEWLTVGTHTYATQQDKEMGNYKDMLNFMRQSTPGLVGEYNGKYGYPEAPEESATANNLYCFLNSKEGDDRVSRFNTTVFSEIDIFKGLSWRFNLNYARRFDEYNSHTNGASREQTKFSEDLVMFEATPPSLMSTYYKTYANESYTLENLLNYETTVGENHDISVLAGYNENYFFGYDHNSTKKGLIDQSISTPGSATEMISINGGAVDYAMRSWFGRVNYGFKQKYLLEANFRYDGSSRFHEDNRWGVFPSFSAAWRLSEESFMQDLRPFFQNLKLRASWGQLGNNVTQRGSNVENYAYQAVYGDVGYSFGGAQVAGLRPTIIANPSLEWENTTMTNVGLDFTALDSRITADMDFYSKVTDGILTVPPIYLTAGLIGAPIRNTAEVANKGLELTLGWRDKVGEVSYSVSGNFSYNHNEVTRYKGKLEEGWRTDENGDKYYYSNLGDVSSGSTTRTLENHIIGEYLVYDIYKGNGNYFNADGTVNPHGGPRDGMIRTKEDMDWLKAMVDDGARFFPNQDIKKNGIWYGDYIYADNNGDGTYGNAYDSRFTETSSIPKYTFGLSMNLAWKDFDLSMVWSGMAGNELYWNESGYNRPNLRIGNQVGEILANDHYYFNEDDINDPVNNIEATYPRLKLDEGDSQNTEVSTAWLYDASFIKLRNLTLGYTLPSHLVQKIHTQRIRVYFSAENLFTITSFPGLDPEMGANSNYPIMRQISFGTNISF